MNLVCKTHQTKIIDLVEVISEGLNCFYVIRPPCLGNTALVQGPQRPQVGADRQRTGRHGTQHLLQPLQSAVSDEDVQLDAGEVPAVQVSARGDAMLHEEGCHDITEPLVQCSEYVIHGAELYVMERVGRKDEEDVHVVVS